MTAATVAPWLLDELARPSPLLPPGAHVAAYVHEGELRLAVGAPGACESTHCAPTTISITWAFVALAALAWSRHRASSVATGEPVGGARR